MSRLSSITAWKAGIIFVAIMLAAALPSTAQQISYESAAVGRIVGDSPDEMRQQLTGQDLQLGEASYFGDNSVFSTSDTERAKGIISMLKEKFPGAVDAHFVESLTLGRWGWSDVKESVDDMGAGLLLLEAHGNVERGMAKAESPDYFDGSLTSSNLDWNLKGRNLVLFDSDFAGAHLPKVSSFAEKLNKDAVIIAPTAVPNKEFAKIFACNLGKYSTIGETYRESRNNYYWQANRPSGIALMSYELYGNPTASVSVPSYDESSFDEFCKDFLKNYAGTAVASSTASPSLSLAALSEGNQDLPLQHTRESVFAIESYSIADAGEHTFLLADGTALSAQENELMLPTAFIVEEFPPKTVITGVRAVSFDDSVDIGINNLPMWYGEPVKRECVSESRNASVGFSNSYTGSKEIVTVTLSPVDVVSCSEGKLKLYKKAKYAIDYIPFSPVLVKEAAVQGEAFPGESIALNVSLQNLQGTAFEGEIVLNIFNGSEKKRVDEEKVSFVANQQEATAELAFTAPSNEGISNYRIEFIREGEVKTFHDFSIAVKALELSFDVPVTARENGEAVLVAKNSLSAPVDAVISSYLLKGEETVTAVQQKTFQPGSNEVRISYDGLKREDAIYDLMATVNYGSEKESASAKLVTNHPPMIASLSDVVVTEGEKVALNPNAADIDGDALEITYAGDMESGEWQTEIGDKGEYNAQITASDGLLSDSQAVKITVLEDLDVDNDGYEKDVDCNDADANVSPEAVEACNEVDDNCNLEVDEERVCNTAPVLQQVGNRSVVEEEQLSIELSVSDAENDELTYSASSLPEGASFEANALGWVPGSQQAGAYKVVFSVSDGLETDEEEINITVLNLNQPARFENAFENITVNEGEQIEIVLQPHDEENDQMGLEVVMGLLSAHQMYSLPTAYGATFSPAANTFAWKPGYDKAGQYSVKIILNEHISPTEGRTTEQKINVTVLENLDCEEGTARPCPLQSGVCSGSVSACTGGKWAKCEAASYGERYELEELGCDGLDNDCDGIVDEHGYCTLRNSNEYISGGWRVGEESVNPVWSKAYAEHALIAESKSLFSDVEVKAEVVANSSAPEVGICTRLSLDGKGYCLSSGWGGTRQITLARFKGFPFEPVQMKAGPHMPASGSGRLYLKLQANGSVLKGKAWSVGWPEPDWQVMTTTDVMGEQLSSGFIGYYAYNTNATFKYYSASPPGFAASQPETTCVDSDGDGQQSSACGGTDCDDGEESVYLGADEQCNGADDDCDGEADEGCLLGAGWVVVNGNWAYDNGRVMPTSYGYGGHPIVVKGGEDFTNALITATGVNNGGKNELGVCGRMSADGKGYCLAHGGGGIGRVVLRRFDGFPYNPVAMKIGPDIGVKLKQPYSFKLLLNGSEVKGKVWRADEDEPEWQVQDKSSRYTTGNAGFYTYYTNATFENLGINVIN